MTDKHPNPTSLLCRIFGHKWRVFLQEQCTAEYAVCILCDRIRHGCNEIDWATHSPAALKARAHAD